MIKLIMEGWDALLRVGNTMPIWLVTALVSWLVSTGLTQGLKFMIPFQLSADIRHRLSQLLAFAVAIGAAYAVWPTLHGLLVGLIMGLWSPWVFEVALRWASGKWPVVGDVLSQDVRRVVTPTGAKRVVRSKGE